MITPRMFVDSIWITIDKRTDRLQLIMQKWLNRKKNCFYFSMQFYNLIYLPSKLERKTKKKKTNVSKTLTCLLASNSKREKNGEKKLLIRQMICVAWFEFKCFIASLSHIGGWAMKTYWWHDDDWHTRYQFKIFSIFFLIFFYFFDFFFF